MYVKLSSYSFFLHWYDFEFLVWFEIWRSSFFALVWFWISSIVLWEVVVLKNADFRARLKDPHFSILLKLLLCSMTFEMWKNSRHRTNCKSFQIFHLKSRWKCQKRTLNDASIQEYNSKSPKNFHYTNRTVWNIITKLREFLLF